MWFDPEAFDAPDPNPLRRLSIINVGSMERLLRSVPGDTPVFLLNDVEDLEDGMPLMGIYYATSVRCKVEDLSWDRLTMASEAEDAVAIGLKF